MKQAEDQTNERNGKDRAIIDPSLAMASLENPGFLLPLTDQPTTRPYKKTGGLIETGS